jgi:diguanylate cyclase (GGDEF)-like protein
VNTVRSSTAAAAESVAASRAAERVRRLLPLSAELGPVPARVLGAISTLLCTLLAIIAVVELFDVGGVGTVHFVRDWLGTAVFILIAAVACMRLVFGSSNRRAWALVVPGGVLACAAWVFWLTWISHMPKPPIPSVCDFLWYCAYPLVFSGLLVLLRRGFEGGGAVRVWLDAVLAAAGMTAVIGAFLIPIVTQVSGKATAVGTAISYPLADMLVVAMLFGGFALRGWRWDRMWTLLIAGFLVSVVADVIVAAAGIRTGSNGYSELPEWLYALEFSLVAFASWQPEPQASRQRLEHWSVLVLPTGFSLGALALLVYNEFSSLPIPVFVLAIVTLLAATARTSLAFRDVLTLSDVRRQAMTDELTELPNRRLFMRRLRDLIAAAELSGQSVSAMLLDLDNFKWINDTLGHEAGDELLRMIGPRLQQALRATDTIARLGGDEFAILLDPAPDQAGLERVAEKLLAALRDPFEVHGVSFRLTASIGIASFPDHADGPEGLMKCADVAMYLAKEFQQGWELYASDRDVNSKERLILANELASALEDGQIQAYYQPIAHAGSRAIIGAEALVRWIRPNGTVLPPSEFVPIAARAGLSRALTRRVLELALAQLHSWRAAGHQLRVSVNTTVADLLDVDFPEEVATALSVHAVPADALVLEVTESSILSDPARISAVLAHLRQLGIGVALDDFGTGYSSLAHLRTLSVGEVKIDRSFVSGMSEEQTDAAIVYATIELAHKLGHAVVAEGVEDDRTWEALNVLGCDRIQGYALAKPMPPDEFLRLLAESAGLESLKAA